MAYLWPVSVAVAVTAASGQWPVASTVAVAVSYLWHVLVVVLCKLYGLGPVLLGVADGGGAVLLGVRVRLDRQVQATEWGGDLGG